MSAPVARTLSGSIAFTVPAVPTGMKAGVRISPRGVASTPVRAAPSRASIRNVVPLATQFLLQSRTAIGRNRRQRKAGAATGPRGGFSYIFAREFARTDAMNIETEPVEGAPLIAPSTTDHPLYD